MSSLRSVAGASRFRRPSGPGWRRVSATTSAGCECTTGTAQRTSVPGLTPRPSPSAATWCSADRWTRLTERACSRTSSHTSFSSPAATGSCFARPVPAWPAPDDRRDFVQSTIRFLESASDYYAEVTAAPPVQRVLRQWQQMVEAQGRMVISDLNASPALYQALRAAYRHALETLVETAARLTNRPATAIYEEHRVLIPDWAFPTQRVAGITADLPTEARVDARGRASVEVGQVSVVAAP